MRIMCLMISKRGESPREFPTKRLSMKTIVVYFAKINFFRMSLFDLKSYHYELPEELIAQQATHPHHDARLIIVDRESGDIEQEGIFMNLADILNDNRVLFFNNSRVLPARIPLKERSILRHDGTSGTITDGEILFCQKLPGDTFEALVRPGSKFRI